MAAAEAKDDGGAVGTVDDTPPSVFVTVNAPFQVVHHGIVFGPGETVQVPEGVAALWITSGWVAAK